MTLNNVFHSWLFLPINEERFRNKVKQLKADIFVFDLEDAIFYTEKDASRKLIRKLKSLRIGLQRMAVRVNNINTKWGYQDIVEVVNNGIMHVVYPKVSNAEEIDEIISILKQIKGKDATKIRITPIIESITGLVNAEEIISRLNNFSNYLIFGSEDFLSECAFVDRGYVQNNVILMNSLARLSIVASKHKKLLIDCANPCYDSEEDLINFKEECEFTKRLGTIGKLAIHPKQLQIINTVFSKCVFEDRIETLIDEVMEVVDKMQKLHKSTIKYKNHFVGIPEVKKLYNRIMNYMEICAEAGDADRKTILRDLDNKIAGLIGVDE